MRPADAALLAELVEPMRSRLTALLSMTGDKVWIGSGRRSFEEQVQLRRKNCGTSWEAIYTWPSSSCSPPTARPGHSLHEKGLAADLEGDLALAATHMGAVGLHRPVRGENWHFEADPAATGFLQNDIPGPIDDAIGDVLGGVESAVGNVLGDLVDPLVEGVARMALVTVLLLGGVGLVALGALRGSSLPGFGGGR